MTTHHYLVYGIYHGTEEDPQFVYVGETDRSLDQRWAEHLKAARDGSDMKPLYEEMRHRGIDSFKITLLGTSAEGATEAGWEKLLKAEGYALLNVGTTLRKASKKKRDMSWHHAQKEAEQRRWSQAVKDPEVQARYKKWLDETMAAFHAKLEAAGTFDYLKRPSSSSALASPSA